MLLGFPLCFMQDFLLHSEEKTKTRCFKQFCLSNVCWKETRKEEWKPAHSLFCFVSARSNMHRYKAQNHRVPNGRKQKKDPWCIWSSGSVQCWFRRRMWGVLWRISHVHEVSYILERQEHKQEVGERLEKPEGSTEAGSKSRARVLRRAQPTRSRWAGSLVNHKDSLVFCFIPTLTPANVLSPSNRDKAQQKQK